MFQILTLLHSATRWLVLAGLIFSIIRAYKGMVSASRFSKADNSIRHWTATITHIQLMLGIILYTQSPLVKYFWQHFSVAVKNPDTLFFGLIHILLMLTAVVIVTIGSALAKRRTTDQHKYKTMFSWFLTALILILLAVPWPFYPFAARPLLR